MIINLLLVRGTVECVDIHFIQMVQNIYFHIKIFICVHDAEHGSVILKTKNMYVKTVDLHL